MTEGMRRVLARATGQVATSQEPRKLDKNVHKCLKGQLIISIVLLSGEC